MLKVLIPDSPRDADYLSQMHQLRYKRFVAGYGWKQGIHAINQMEFDRFDEHSAPLYLANIGENDRVDTVVRLIQTTKPNYTLDEFAQNAKMTDDTRASDIIELSCSSSDRNMAPQNALAPLVMGLLELGEASKVRHYISTVNTLVQGISDKMKWNSTEISARVDMDKQSFVVLKYPVGRHVTEQFRAANHFSEKLLASEEIERCQLRNRILGI